MSDADTDGDARNEAVRAIVRSIPAGRVMAYGDIAALVPKASARSVGRVMKDDSHDLPWWRVVNSAGRPPPGAERVARLRFEAEGTPLRDRPGAPYLVDIARARWAPP